MQTGANDCPRLNKLYSDAFDKLKSMTDIKPKVVEDLTSIREKFPCNVYVYNLINVLVRNFCFSHTSMSTYPLHLKYI